MDTLTFELSLLIYTDLRANSRFFTFIHIFTSRVAIELVSMWAVTVISSRHINTDVRTATVFYSALIYITESLRFVFPGRAIRLLIANQTLIDTHSSTTVKLCFRITTVGGWAAIYFVTAITALSNP